MRSPDRDWRCVGTSWYMGHKSHSANLAKTVTMSGAATKLLVLDLDETLVCALPAPLERPHDFMVGPYFIYKRPHLDSFVQYALTNFMVGVWTSSGNIYADGVTKEIFPAGSLRFVWSSERCTIARDWDTGNHYALKRLDKLKRHGYPLESIIMVDDTAQKHRKNYGNLVTVSEYNGEASDGELPLLMRYLDQLKDAKSIRAVEKRGWRRNLASP